MTPGPPADIPPRVAQLLQRQHRQILGLYGLMSAVVAGLLTVVAHCFG